MCDYVQQQKGRIICLEESMQVYCELRRKGKKFKNVNVGSCRFD